MTTSRQTYLLRLVGGPAGLTSFLRAIGDDAKRLDRIEAAHTRLGYTLHLSPEAKFANGQYLDRGRTVRRHVIATVLTLIGQGLGEIHFLMPDPGDGILGELFDLENVSLLGCVTASVTGNRDTRY